MKKQTIKKILVWSGGIFLFLVVVLAVHIYMVTRPKAPDATTVIMARLDFKQDLSKDDAVKVTNWLYEQDGVDHATCNADTKTAVFTYHPIKMTGEQIVSRFKSELKYNAVRFLPSADQMKNGCPVATTSTTYKLVNYFKNMF